MEKSLPKFIYITDDYAGTVFLKNSIMCDCCQKESPYQYNGPVYSVEEGEITLCPWCIHDGSAAEKYAASFNDIYDESLEEAIITTVCEQTPGYSSWQDQGWAAHCKDACVYHGDASAQDVADASEPTRQKWMRDYEQDAESWDHFMKGYQPGGDQGVYKFHCRHCDLIIFNWDFS
ncbi:hypothetical protein CYR55_16990 [Chimaeribacter californicus]|uniref:CbrC family protein n=1 Tax=Chimaeribacter californicus TaxID=2060067 RepID=A0A2N5DZL0_9GAMM|nr:CbrC family protein [Chimaeribacter californicus]PLR33282.1 hypothetical protein CYR55_16990 [Chimaeribacter californicus]